MAEQAATTAPFDPRLLVRFLEAPGPAMDGADERLEKVNGLVSRGDYLGAARGAEALLREGLHDVRLAGPYLMGVFLDGGLQAMPVVFQSLSFILIRNWTFLGPRERKEASADAGLRWLLKMLNKHLEHHERLKDGTWQRWCASDHRAPLEQALALSEEIFSAFPRVMPRNDCEAPFRRLTQWMEGHLQSLPAVAAAVEEEPEAAVEEPEAPPERPRPAADPAGPSLPISPALAQLMRKLAAFDALLEQGDHQRAGVVAADVLQVLEHFDPRVYLPSLFSRFFAGLSAHAEQVEPMMQGTESLAFRALDHLYRVDLDAFLAQGAGPAGAEEG